MLRYNGSVEFSTSRWALEDIEFRGQHIAQGELVIVALDSANRDEQQFKDADIFDITREKVHIWLLAKAFISASEPRLLVWKVRLQSAHF